MALPNYTPEEIGAMADANENFIGHTLDLSRVQLWRDLRDRCKAMVLEEGSPFVSLQTDPPKETAQTAAVSMELRTPCFIMEEQTAQFSALTTLADAMAFAAVPGKNRLKITLIVENIWKD